MTIKKKALLSLVLCSALFGTLVLLRVGRLPLETSLEKPVPGVEKIRTARSESWMEIRQDGRPIGYCHRLLEPVTEGYRIRENVVMRINTMGMVQQVNLITGSRLASDFSLVSFDFSLQSGLFSFSARGRVKEGVLQVVTGMAGDERTHHIPLQHPVRLANSVFQNLTAATLVPGKRLSFDIFDPASLASTAVVVQVGEREEIETGNEKLVATKVTLEFGSMRQKAWIDAQGEVVKESGLLGIEMVRSTRQAATAAAYGQASDDLTLRASVPVKATFTNPEILSFIKLRITGVEKDRLALDGGRQALTEDVLTITKETGEIGSSDSGEPLPAAVASFLKSTPYVQSDHPDIIAAVHRILGDAGDPPANAAQRRSCAEKIVKWVYASIEKKPVLSMPDAISTLKNRVGDCNEHAVLTAALGRAAGIPVRVEAGLVYMKGRFYYHAWDAFYLDRWVTADTVLGQFPADVTHLRLTVGAADAQLELMGVLGRIGIEILESSP